MLTVLIEYGNNFERQKDNDDSKYNNNSNNNVSRSLLLWLLFDIVRPVIDTLLPLPIRRCLKILNLLVSFSIHIANNNNIVIWTSLFHDRFYGINITFTIIMKKIFILLLAIVIITAKIHVRNGRLVDDMGG